MKKIKWIILLLILCAALPFVVPVGAKGIGLNFGPIIVNTVNFSGTIYDVPGCDADSPCDGVQKVTDLREVFKENKLVPEGEWLENKLREIRKEIETSDCGNYSMEDTINSIVVDHVNYCKTTANPHLKENPDSIEDILYVLTGYADIVDILLKKGITEDKLKEYIKSHSDLFAYTNNCQATSLSYAMCRQGYDVQAHGNKGSHYGMSYIRLIKEILKPEHLYVQGNGEWDKNISQPAEWTDGIYEISDRSTLEVIEEKMAEWEDGTVIIINVGLNIGSGHVFTAEKVNGKIVFIDPQRPDLNSEEVSEYFNGITVSNFFKTNNIDFSDKLDQLTQWVDEKEAVEQTNYYLDHGVW